MSVDPVTTSAVDVDDEPYNSEEDEDFQLEAAQDYSDLSSSDDEAEPAKKKRKTDQRTEIPVDELDSGDEVTIQRARDKRIRKCKVQKSKAKSGADEDEDEIDIDDDEEGGAGGFVRTRAMKKQIQEDRKPLAQLDGATVDVNALWEQMNAPGNELGVETKRTEPDNQLPLTSNIAADADLKDHDIPKPEDSSYRDDQYSEQMIKIKRTYKFAGEMITEEKIVPRDSAEAKAFLSSGENVEYVAVSTEAAAGNSRALRRPLRKISRFDPNPTGTIKKSWEKQPVVEPGLEQDAQGPKINTVEKSRLDWARYVDKAGIQDELRVHSKAKEGYIGRMDFLGRVEAKRDEEARQARLKGM